MKNKLLNHILYIKIDFYLLDCFHSITIAAFGRGVGYLCPAISQLHYSQSFKGQPLILWAYISSQMSMFILVPFQGRETLQLLVSNPFGQTMKVAHFCESLENVETQTCTAKNE